MKKFFIPFILFSILIGVFLIGLQGDPREIPSPFIGKPAPNFSLPELYDPSKIISNNSLKGEVVLINVWASWCTACRQEHHHLLELTNKYNINLIGLDYKDTAQDAKNWLEEFKNPYSDIAFDHDGRVGIDWGVYGVPETFVLDKQGIIRHKVIGPIDDSIIQNDLLPLINELNNNS